MKTTELYLKFILVIVTLCSCTHTSSVENEYLYMGKDELEDKIRGGGQVRPLESLLVGLQNLNTMVPIFKITNCCLGVMTG